MASRRIGMFGVEPSEFVDDRKEDGVAALLRRRREELGRDVAAVARQLRIRAIYIQAIEEGRLQDLPGTAYAVGFVRAYADYLGLDGNSIVSDYRDELARRSRQNQLIWPVDQVEQKHFPGSIILVVSLVLAVAISGGWYFASQPGGTGIDLIDQVPEFMKKQSGDPVADEPAAVEPAGDQSSVPAGDTAATSTAEATPPIVTTVPAASATATSGSTPSSAQAASELALPPVAPETPIASTAPAAISEVPADTAASTVPAVPPEVATGSTDATSSGSSAVLPATTPDTAELAATGSAASPAPTAATGTEDLGAEVPTADATQTATADPAQPAMDGALENGTGNRIVLRAAKDSWVEIFDAEQKVVLQRILRAGETYAVPDQEGLVMNTGNAGGLVIEVNGRAQPSLGSIGVVKRGINLSPSALIQ
jgi:cytoskeleton protein RodZ